MFCCVMFFFFQAEDGIRDADVTGVQTCALPISSCRCSPTREGVMAPVILPLLVAVVVLGATPSAAAQAPAGPATLAWPMTIAPRWFVPSTPPPPVTPFVTPCPLPDTPARPNSRQQLG